jgi:hypothetical protein
LRERRYPSKAAEAIFAFELDIALATWNVRHATRLALDRRRPVWRRLSVRLFCAGDHFMAAAAPVLA